jgi:thiopeptide-type bacteriocin biosynthesis protein
MTRSGALLVRKRKSRLRRLLSPETSGELDPSGELEVILADRRRRLVAAAQELTELNDAGALTDGPENLHSSYVHMHHNRLIGTETAPSEAHLLNLLCRTQRGLLLAPVQRNTESPDGSAEPP